jgi:hypothetical protein
MFSDIGYPKMQKNIFFAKIDLRHLFKLLAICILNFEYKDTFLSLEAENPLPEQSSPGLYFAG